MRRLGIVLALLVTCTPCWSALAQTVAPSAEEKAAARTLGVTGLEALGKEQYDVALDAFDRALGLFDFPTLRLGRARALVGLGRFVEASEEYRTILNGALDDSEQLRRVEQDAERELGEVKSKIGYVTMSVTPRDASVRLDGKELPAAMFEVPIPMDPGEHELVATAAGHMDLGKRIGVASGQTQQVTLTLEPSAEARVAPLPQAGPPTRESGTATAPQVAEPGHDSNEGVGTGTYVAGGATLVLTGAAVLTGIVALQRRSDFNRINDAETEGSVKRAKRDDAVSMAWISTGLSAGAVVGAALTTYLLFDTDDEVAASLYTDGRGAWLSASFAF